MAKGENRFDIQRAQGSLLEGYVSVIVDRQTGVNYMYYSSGNTGGLTPLLDSDGKVVVTPVYSTEE